MKACSICHVPKTAPHFDQWIVYNEDGKGRKEGPRKKFCKVCEEKLYAHTKIDLKTKLQLRKEERQLKEMMKKADEDRKKAAASKIKQAKNQKKRRQANKIQTKSDFERELLLRELARKSLIEFIKRFNPEYKAGWVHEDICRRLAKFLLAIQDGRSPRLMLFMPPRHGKSMIASHHFPAWALGHVPELEIIAASYGSSLPMKFSRQVRAFLRDKRYNVLFPETKLDRTNENVEGWSTTKGGGYIPAGVGGGITGKGAHLFIVDDPVKDAEEADSETIRDNTWDWWGSTAYTRLAPNAGVLVIQTRWHDDDLSGRMIMQMKEENKEANELKEMWEAQGLPQDEVDAKYSQALREIDQWEIIEYPAIALEDEWLNMDGTTTSSPLDAKSKFLRMKGDALHEERFDYTRLMKIKRTLQPRHWSALYQQNPVPEEGMYFTKNMFRYMDTPTLSELPMVITWDLAIGQKQQNDYTVGIVGALDQYDVIHVVDVVRGKWDTHQIAENIIDTYQRYDRMTTGNVRVGIESGALQMAIMPHLNKLMQERRSYISLVPEDQMRPITDKLARARPLQGRLQQGKLVFPPASKAGWVEDVLHEMLRFPGGVHDDIVDALAWLARVFATTSPPKKAKPKKIESWKDRLRVISHGDKHPMTS